MFLKKISVMSAALILIVSVRCNTKSDPGAGPVPATVQGETELLQLPEILKSNCYLCHNPNAPSHDAIIAPPLAAVKMRYNRQYQTKEEFVNNMTTFLVNPTKEKAIMYGAVDRFGIMPRAAVEEKILRELVEYIYSNKLEEPPWLKQEMGGRGM